MIRAAILCLIATPAFGLTCGTRDEIRNQLARNYGQYVVRAGETDARPARLMELYTNARLGTWSITMTTEAGEDCIFSSGGRFTVVAPGDPS